MAGGNSRTRIQRGGLKGTTQRASGGMRHAGSPGTGKKGNSKTVADAGGFNGGKGLPLREVRTGDTVTAADPVTGNPSQFDK